MDKGLERKERKIEREKKKEASKKKSLERKTERNNIGRLNIFILKYSTSFSHGFLFRNLEDCVISYVYNYVYFTSLCLKRAMIQQPQLLTGQSYCSEYTRMSRLESMRNWMKFLVRRIYIVICIIMSI